MRAFNSLSLNFSGGKGGIGFLPARMDSVNFLSSWFFCHSGLVISGVFIMANPLPS